ncbi:TubC N-terminal docking domain-related protein [Burkholderia vietnamiensis]|uniref:TubC N-terminal docking domain-related protein n=1 Tax=Burkholderia vietnamiensis TaxID=60552 RepID=UPI001CF5BB36|nr:hypothetical protein [Burkholderia vietnamiensis]MCA8199194.1 hypothetical protein [Burkholderia vietnamiensis]
MSLIAQFLSKAESLGVRLRLDGEIVRMNGPKEARDAIRADVITYKPEIVAYLRATANSVERADCEGALRTRDGSLYLPWGPRLPPDEVREMRTELVSLIEAIADYECWPETLRDEVRARAVRGPLADLLPNLHHFRERVIEAAAEYQAREALAARAWMAGASLTNRGS